ncbi:MAG TPA: folylpolyglutamate synthase/dihydrofolate synthase family protein [Stellaceae bacterium]|nr:folylpolyglutamate synthase/dihydrofolate synthase family protein [Stellaceae bacterium]
MVSDEILARLLTLHPKLIDLSLDRVLRLLAALGNPQDKLPPVVHVAGTNGKGSTVAFLRSCLEAAGKRVHVYTSPHLVRFAERIRLAGKLIEEDALVAILEECERANAGAPITFFEITTAAAFLAFSRIEADYALIEVGLGGRFDATNVIARPAVTAITPVSLDHQHFLGDTIAQIAFEKAGILKPRVPAVIAPQVAAAAAVIDARAQEIGAALYRAGTEWSVAARDDRCLAYRGRSRLILPQPGLLGPHQYANAGTALACLERLPGFAFSAETLAQGLQQVEWPGRLQRLDHGALARLMPSGAELWLDGGHNAAGGAALAAQAQSWRDKKLKLVFGMLNTHDAAGFIGALAPYAAALEALAIPGEENARPAEEIAQTARSLGLAATAQPSIAAAVQAAAEPGARVLICGSLYLAGRVLAENGSPP